MKIYDETVSKEFPALWADGDSSAVDLYYLHVRLFKVEIPVERYEEPGAVYIHVNEYTSYVGDPATQDRAPKKRQTKRAFVFGTDAEHIRRAIRTVDAFKGEEVK